MGYVWRRYSGHQSGRLILRPAMSYVLTSSPLCWMKSKNTQCVTHGDCTTLQGLPTTMLGHKPDTLRALGTYMALADVLLQLWLKVSPGSWWVGTTGQGTPMKCSHAHECCDRHQMSWQRPTVSTDHHFPHTHMGTCTHILHLAVTCILCSACPTAPAIWHTVSGLSILLLMPCYTHLAS